MGDEPVAGGARAFNYVEPEIPQEDSEDDGSSSASSAVGLLASKPRAFFESPFNGVGNELAIEYFNGYQVCDMAKVLVENGGDGRPEIPSRNAAYPFINFISWMRENRDNIQRWMSKGRKSVLDSQIVLVFGTQEFHHLLQLENERERNDKVMEILFEQSLDNTPVMTLFTTGVVGNFEASDERQRSAELENYRLPCLSGLAIPEVYGMQLRNFVITAKQEQESRSDFNCEKLMDLLGLADVNVLQGIVIFMKQTGKNKPSKFLSQMLFFLMKQKHVSMAGCASDQLYSRGTVDESVFAAGFLVLGDPERVKVACTWFEEPGISANNISKMTKLRNVLLEPRHDDEDASSFGLFFGSNQRGMKMYGNVPGVDSAYFHCNFPRTPLVGGWFPTQFCSAMLHDEDFKWDITAKNATVFIVVSYRHPQPY